ncbi:MAG: hypothetical protein Q8916_13160 [Bacteroidota bacterium]|nr:hypothetical protein [Bacteroidota bacterium]
MEAKDIYRLKNENEVILPASLKDGFLAFLSDNGVQFAPQVKEEDEKALFHFLFLNRPLKDVVEEFLLKFDPDDFWATEIAVPNDRIKQTERIARDSEWISYVRQQGTEKTRLCFVRTPRSVPVTELEERIDLVV